MVKQNSMDVIQIRYGVDLSSPPGINASFKERQAFENKPVLKLHTLCMHIFSVI